jgi:hypothetical protein
LSGSPPTSGRHPLIFPARPRRYPCRPPAPAPRRRLPVPAPVRLRHQGTAALPHRLFPFPPPPHRNRRRTHTPLMAATDLAATASAALSTSPLRPIKCEPESPLHPAPLPSPPPSPQRRPRRSPERRRRSRLDPLHRRRSLPSELPGASPLSSSSFLCIPRRDWWPEEPVWHRR